MAQVKIRGQSGGSSKINGIIEEYKVASGGNVNAGDFVKFVENEYGTENRLDTTPHSGDYISAVLIETNKVFVVYTIGQGTTSFKFNLYGMMCTIERTTITAGVATKLSGDYYNKKSLSVLLINTNKVFITFGGLAIKGDENSNLYSLVCTINEETITVGDITLINEQKRSGNYISTIALGSNKVFIVHSIDNKSFQYSLWGMLCAIEDTEITVKSDIEIYNNTEKPNLCSVTVSLLKDNKLFITFAFGQPNSFHSLYSAICTINGTIITKNTIVEIDNNGFSYGQNIKTLVLEENKILIVFDKYITSGVDSLHGMICIIEDTEITNGTVTKLGPSSPNILAVILSKNKVFIVHYSNILHGMVCKINDTLIEVKSDNQISETTCYSYNKKQSLILLDSYKICILFGISSNAYLNSIVGNIELTNVLESKIDNILGIAKTKGTAGQTVKVIVPKEGEN